MCVLLSADVAPGLAMAELLALGSQDSSRHGGWRRGCSAATARSPAAPSGRRASRSAHRRAGASPSSSRTTPSSAHLPAPSRKSRSCMHACMHGNRNTVCRSAKGALKNIPAHPQAAWAASFDRKSAMLSSAWSASLRQDERQYAPRDKGAGYQPN